MFKLRPLKTRGLRPGPARRSNQSEADKFWMPQNWIVSVNHKSVARDNLPENRKWWPIEREFLIELGGVEILRMKFDVTGASRTRSI